MIEIAEKIAQGYPQVRVDLYNVKGKIYFGEMTFFAFSGMNNHFTKEFQRMIGDRIQLPKITYSQYFSITAKYRFMEFGPFFSHLIMHVQD